MAERGKSSIDWLYGFKLHLIVNDQGELLAFQLTPGNVDDRKPVPTLQRGLYGKLYGDRGYIWKALQPGVSLLDSSSIHFRRLFPIGTPHAEFLQDCPIIRENRLTALHSADFIIKLKQ